MISYDQTIIHVKYNDDQFFLFIYTTYIIYPSFFK
jgi:hypothetical protein